MPVCRASCSWVAPGVKRGPAWGRGIRGCTGVGARVRSERLDRVAGEVNPFLIILMVGLLILNLTRVVTLGLKNLPITRVDPSCLISQTSTTSGIGVVYPPS